LFEEVDGIYSVPYRSKQGAAGCRDLEDTLRPGCQGAGHSKDADLTKGNQSHSIDDDPDE
jgi:hypothetical protein